MLFECMSHIRFGSNVVIAAGVDVGGMAHTDGFQTSKFSSIALAIN